MTVVRLVSTFPKLEKYAKVRSNLEARARSTPRMSLSQNIVGEIPVLVTTMVFDSLEDYEKDRTDPVMWEHRAKITGLMSQLITVRLLSPIVPPAQSIDSGSSHTQQVILVPTPLGQDALRGTLEEFAKEQQAHVRPRFRLAQTIF